MNRKPETLDTPYLGDEFPSTQPFFDHDRAMREGWQLKHCPEIVDEGDYRIEPLEYPALFSTAEDAWAYVAAQATSGSDFHIAALRFVRLFNSAEWERIATHASLALGVDLLACTSREAAAPFSSDSTSY